MRWPSEVAVSVEGDDRVVRANGLPDHPTGVFPVDPADDAHAYDPNPNAIREVEVLLRLPAVPLVAAAPSCLPLGMIGFTVGGTALYDALDARGRDAAAHEVQDACAGHPEVTGQYQYHDLGSCLAEDDEAEEGHSGLLGYALDGFGVFGPHGDDGEELTNADLDACHGHVGTVDWDGQPLALYHYHFTAEYPHSLCFAGTPVPSPVAADPSGVLPPGPGPG